MFVKSLIFLLFCFLSRRGDATPNNVTNRNETTLPNAANITVTSANVKTPFNSMALATNHSTSTNQTEHAAQGSITVRNTTTPSSNNITNSTMHSTVIAKLNTTLPMVPASTASSTSRNVSSAFQNITVRQSTVPSNLNSTSRPPATTAHAGVNVTLTTATPTKTSSVNTTNDRNVTSTNEPVEKTKSSGSKISPGIAILLGIISSCVLIVGVVIIYKYQRRLMYAIRFRRLQEVPMDDFDDDVADAVYADHTVPIRLRL